ncbi:MAG: hypothetical protein V1792_28755 [Pseudomonadota bacterium]
MRNRIRITANFNARHYGNATFSATPRSLLQAPLLYDQNLDFTDDLLYFYHNHLLVRTALPLRACRIA